MTTFKTRNQSAKTGILSTFRLCKWLEADIGGLRITFDGTKTNHSVIIRIHDEGRTIELPESLLIDVLTQKSEELSNTYLSFKVFNHEEGK